MRILRFVNSNKKNANESSSVRDIEIAFKTEITIVYGNLHHIENEIITNDTIINGGEEKKEKKQY